MNTLIALIALIAGVCVVAYCAYTSKSMGTHRRDTLWNHKKKGRT